MNIPVNLFSFSGLSLYFSTLTRLAPKEALLVAGVKMGPTLLTILGGLHRDFESPFTGLDCIDKIMLVKPYPKSGPFRHMLIFCLLK